MNPARPSFICASCARALRNQTRPQTLRSFTSATKYNAASPQTAQPQEDFPRWKQTVPAMKMPIRLRPTTRNSAWRVNDSQEKLDAAYDRFFGRSGGKDTKGRDLLDEETKWITLTHKSHANAAQGNNDRLAFLGKRILDLQCSLLLLSSPNPTSTPLNPMDTFIHPALECLENISPFAKQTVLDKARLAGLANSYGLDRVVRWKPRQVEDLRSSGVEVVLSSAIYAIIGATALKQGGEVAARVARERVLAPLGLR